MKKTKDIEEIVEEYVELFGYLDKYVEGIVGRQGKWFVKVLEAQRKEVIEEAREEIIATLKRWGKDWGSGTSEQLFNRILQTLKDN